MVRLGRVGRGAVWRGVAGFLLPNQAVSICFCENCLSRTATKNLKSRRAGCRWVAPLENLSIIGRMGWTGSFVLGTEPFISFNAQLPLSNLCQVADHLGILIAG